MKLARVTWDVVRWLTAALSIGTVATIAIGLSAWFHASLPLAREAVRTEVNLLVSGLIKGRLEIGELAVLTPTEIVARRVAFFDPDGERVLYGDRVVLVPDLSAALEGWLHFKSARLIAGEVVLIDRNDDNIPSFVEGFDPIEESEKGGTPFRAVIDGLQLEDVEVHGRVIELDGIRVVDAQATGRIEIFGEVTIDIASASGTLVEPFSFEGIAETVSGRFSTVGTEGLELRASGRVDRTDGPTDHVDATLTVRTPEGQDTEQITLDVRADPADASILAELGFEWAELFYGPARGTFRLQGPANSLTFDVDVDTDGGPLTLSGHVPTEGDTRVEAVTEGLELVSVVRGAPDMRFEGTGTLTVDGNDPDAAPEFRVFGQPFGVGDLLFPTFEVDGTIRDDHVEVSRLTTPYAGGKLDLDGRIDFDGTSRARVRGTIPEVSRDPNVRRLASGLRGGVDLDLSFAADREGKATLVSGRTVFRRFRYGPLRADRLRVDGRVGGNSARPDLDVRVDVKGLHLYEVALGDGDGFVDGQSGRYATHINVSTENHSIDLEAAIALPRRGHIEVQSSNATLVLEGKTWRGEAVDLVFSPNEARAGRVTLVHEDETIRVAGSIGQEIDESLEMAFHNLDLHYVEALVDDAPTLAGRLEGRAGIEGSLDNPVFDIEGTLLGGAVGTVTGIDAFFTAGVGHGEFDFTGQASLSDRGELTLSGDGYLDPSASDVRSMWEDALYEQLSLHATDLDLSAAGEFFPTLAGVSGRFTGDADLTGPLQAPNLSGRFSVPDLSVPGWPVLGTQGSAVYEAGVLRGRGTVRDESGELVETEVNLLLDLYELAVEPEIALASLSTLPWRVSVRTPERRITTLPDPIQALLPEALGPLSLALSGTAAGGGLRTHADLFVSGKYDDDLHETLCGTSHRPTFTGSLAMADGQTTINLASFLGVEPLIRVHATADTPVEEWLANAETPQMPEIDGTIELPMGTAGRIPVLCEDAIGDVAARLAVQNWFGPNAQAEASFDVEALRFGDSPPLHGQGSATARDGIAAVRGSLAWDDEEAINVAAEVGIEWPAGTILPTVPPDAPLHADASFDRAPLAPLIAWSGLVEGGSGHLTGSWSVRGLANNPRGSGRVTLEDGYLEIVGLGQHLDNVSGAFVLDGSKVRIEDFTARDIEGEAIASGVLRFEGIRPSRATLALESRGFPVRSEGAVLATVVGRASLEATLEQDGTDVQVDMESLDVTLPDRPSRSVQALDSHPEISVVGAERGPAAPVDPHPVRFHVETARPFEVHRSDFSATVSADLVATYRDPDLIVDGTVVVEDGHYEAFGKRFDIQDGTMQFDGTPTLDPLINIVVTHRVATADATVTVVVTSRLSNPKIEFRSDHPDCRERATVIAMLVTGRCGSRGSSASDAQAFDEQTAEFLGGILAGVGTLFLREQLGGAGDFLPNVTIDQGRYGPRVRAGVNLDFLIPNFLRGAIQSIHADAHITAPNTQQGQTFNQAVLPGGILEAIFHYGFVFRFRIDAGGFGSDLTWEP